MTDSPLVLRNGNQVSPKDEIYPRDIAGQIGPRLGVVGDLVPTLNCYQIIVVEKLNEERIIEAIWGMLEGNRLQELRLSYEAILDTFQTYVDHGDLETLVRTQYLCTEEAPKFGGAFKKALTEFNPYLCRNFREDALKNALDPLITAADAYLVVLSIAFHSQTKRTPSTALNDRVVLPKIEAALELLEKRLENTLLPDGTVKGSPMASLLLRGKAHWFLDYYPYCKEYVGAAGIVQMTSEANEMKSEKYWEGYMASSQIPSDVYYDFADTLIELIVRFKALRTIRLNFDPDTKPLADPREILLQPKSETPALIAQDPSK